jgi:peptide/nickel transport system substrate-binding protein
MDPVKRAAHFIRMNDLVVQNMVVIPLVWRNWVSGVGNKLKGTEISGWDSSFWNLRHWHREA